MIGANENLNLASKLRTLIKKELIKIALSTNALIITNGINSGVSKLVGEAFAEAHCDLGDVTILGVAPWGIVADRDQLEVKKILNKAFLKKDNELERLIYKVIKCSVKCRDYKNKILFRKPFTLLMQITSPINV